MVAALGWSKTGTDSYTDATSGQTSVTLNAGTVGDLRVLEFLIFSSGAINVSTVSGGGVTTWARAGSVNTISAATLGSGSSSTCETWWGPITSTGTALTLTFSGSIGSDSVRSMQRDFRSLRGRSVFSVVNTGFAQDGGAVTGPFVFASTLNARSGGLVVGVSGNIGSGGAASTGGGYVSSTDGDGNTHVYRLNSPGNTSEACQLTYTGSDSYYGMSTVFYDGYLDEVMPPPPRRAVATRAHLI